MSDIDFEAYWKDLEKRTANLKVPPLPYFRLKAIRPEEAAGMSCHDIGHAIDGIINLVLEMYDNGRISKDVILEMIREFPKAVHWCDGNEYEAQETLTKTHCAACLKKYESTDEIICYDDLDIEDEDLIEEFKGGRRRWWFEVLQKVGFNGRSLCRSCFEIYLAKNLSETGKMKILG